VVVHLDYITPTRIVAILLLFSRRCDRGFPTQSAETGSASRVLPAHAEMMYTPEISGRSDEAMFEVSGRKEQATHPESASLVSEASFG
jgi:hypothetical protein